MNRMDEYKEWMAELEQPVSDLAGTYVRAQKRRHRKNLILRPVISVAAVFALFVLAVNCSAKVAYACSRVPILKELAEAVTFSRSLTDAVENEYVQSIDLVQESNGVTVAVEYLIVDQKQVNVFFRLTSENETEYMLDPEVLTKDSTYAGCSYGLNNFDVPNGELQSITIDFYEEDVPDSLILKLGLNERGTGFLMIPEETAGNERFEEHIPDTDYEAEFEFLLEFDPQFTAVGKVYLINKTVMLDGNEIIIREMEVYPTHLRVNIEESLDNKDWLQGLEFYIKTDWGMKFEAVSNGTVSTSSQETPELTSYRADSTYFYEADHLEIVITGADWLEKSKEDVYVNLVTGETKGLPEHVKYAGAKRYDDGWEVTFDVRFQEENHFAQTFDWNYYDAEGNKYNVHSWSHMLKTHQDVDSEEYYEEILALKEYPYSEVWLKLYYTHSWEAEEPVAILVQ